MTTTPGRRPATGDQVVVPREAELAWPGGDRPGEARFECPVPATVSDAITRALEGAFPSAAAGRARYAALRPPSGPVGRYRLSTPDGTWFVRVSSRAGQAALEKAITDHLVRHGVPVNALLVAGVPLAWSARTFRVDVRPMVEGRHFAGAADDLVRVAASVSACHRALRAFGAAEEVRAVAACRRERLARVRALVAEALECGRFDVFGERADWASGHRWWLADMVEGFDPGLDRPDAQCVHGEIHPGNVLFRARDQAAVLLDFEESTHLFVPPAWDLAFLVQRFCLRDRPPLPVARQRLAAVAEGYGSELPPLAPMMRQAAWLSVATAIDGRITEHVITPATEYDKFVALESQARALEGVL